MSQVQSHQYYVDRYDRHTVESGRLMFCSPASREGQDKEREKIAQLAAQIGEYIFAGERYANRSHAIDAWRKRDEERERILRDAVPPRLVGCLTCGRAMAESSRHLHTDDRALIFLDCPVGHLPRRAFYGDGAEFRREPSRCARCGGSVAERDESSEAELVTVVSCAGCGHVERSAISLSPEEPAEDPNFARDRARFCMTDEAGQRFITEKAQLENCASFLKEADARRAEDGARAAAARLRIVAIAEIVPTLEAALSRDGYSRVRLGEPSAARSVTVSLAASDDRPGRDAKESVAILVAAVGTSLAGTNWRVLPKSASCRLGVLGCQLVGVDHEDDLLELARDQTGKTP